MREVDTSEKVVISTKKRGFFQAWRNLRIAFKLLFGFGLLIIITFIAVGISYLAGDEATQNIDRTEQLRVPTALDSASARADLLRMLANVQGYLALGDEEYRDEYNKAQQAFETDLARLQARLAGSDSIQLADLQTKLNEWDPLPNELFELRNDQERREPAFQILEQNADVFGAVLRDINNMIDTQARLALSVGSNQVDSVELLKDMANFQGSFSQIISGLRGYVTTRRPAFKFEYTTAVGNNGLAWERLTKKYDKMPLTQQRLIDEISINREAFLAIIPDIIVILEDPDGKWRTDLYRFRTEAVPLIEEMLTLLDGLTTEQQESLKEELARGRESLIAARNTTLLIGFLALALGIMLTFVLQSNIAGPVVRLTGVAHRIKEGNLKTQADVESTDEIGVLSNTFNAMTTQLNQTLEEVKREKQRADSLLEIVIPIGVDLTTQQDLNRLLETMLLEAKRFCNADSGILYLCEDDWLTPEIVHNDTLNIAVGNPARQKVEFPKLPLFIGSNATRHDMAIRAAVSGYPVNVANAPQKTEDSVFDVFKEWGGYDGRSFLSIPLKNNEGDVLGVLELINARLPGSDTIVPFDQNIQEMMESFSSLAVAALETYLREQSLKQEILRLRVEIDEVKHEKEEDVFDLDLLKGMQEKFTPFIQKAKFPRVRLSEDKRW